MSKLTDFLADMHNEFHDVWEVEALLPAHDAEIVERTKAELFNQLYATAGTEVLDAYRTAPPGPLTGADVVKAIRERAKREQMEADCRSLVAHPKIQTIPFNPWSRGRLDGLLESCEVIYAAWTKAHPEADDAH